MVRAVPRDRVVAVAAVMGLVTVATVLHLWAGYTSPRPWPDESHFIAPALSLVQGNGLDAPQLNAPDGIFWMPAGYYVAQAPLLLAGVEPLAAGRLLSLAGVIAFAVALAATAARVGVPGPVAFAACGLWLCLPRVVTIANIARMEGVILAIAGAAVWLVARDRWLLAAALAWVAPLIHPIGLVVSVAVMGAAVVRTGGPPARRRDKIVAAVVAAAWLAQVAYFAANGEATSAHLGFQLTRKADRAISPSMWHWMLLLGAGAAGAVATLRWRRGTRALRAIWLLLALVGGFVLVDVVGREMWYEFLGRETAVLLAFLATTAAVMRLVAAHQPRHRDPSAPSGIRLFTMVAVVVLAIGTIVAARQTFTAAWYGMRGQWSSHSEWRAFASTAVGELQGLDATDGPRETVVIDPLSGFGQEVFSRSWQRLEFVQPTPATPLDATSGDYVLATPGAPFVTKNLVAQWGSPGPALEVSSPRGTYTMQLFRRPDGS